MSDHQDIRKQSVKIWTGRGTIEEINAGSIQRIADATEKMAQRHTELIRERDMYAGFYKSERDRADLLKRQLAAAKGQLTKLKKMRGAS